MNALLSGRQKNEAHLADLLLDANQVSLREKMLRMVSSKCR
jgi:hypothetical protein